jgi:hypothetical protein
VNQHPGLEHLCKLAFEVNGAEALFVGAVPERVANTTLNKTASPAMMEKVILEYCPRRAEVWLF